jgi:hypothetical protein
MPDRQLLSIVEYPSIRAGGCKALTLQPTRGQLLTLSASSPGRPLSPAHPVKGM